MNNQVISGQSLSKIQTVEVFLLKSRDDTESQKSTRKIPNVLPLFLMGYPVLLK